MKAVNCAFRLWSGDTHVKERASIVFAALAPLALDSREVQYIYSCNSATQQEWGEGGNTKRDKTRRGEARARQGKRQNGKANQFRSTVWVDVSMSIPSFSFCLLACLHS